MKKLGVVCLVLLLTACSVVLPQGTVCYQTLHSNDFTYEQMLALQQTEPFHTDTPAEGTDIYLFEGGSWLGLEFDYMQYTFTDDSRTISCYLPPAQDEELSATFARAGAALKQQFGSLDITGEGTAATAVYSDGKGGSLFVRCYDESEDYTGSMVVLFFKFT